MDEFILAQINAAMGSAGFISGEEDQVAGNQLLAGFGTQTKLVLLVCCTGNVDAVFGKDILQIAGTVKSLGGSAAKLVGNTDVRACSLQ